MQKKSRIVPLPPDFEERVCRFCSRTKRPVAHTLRAVLELFFADGDDVAEARLTRGLWDLPADADPGLEPLRSLTPAQRAAYIVDGVLPVPPKAKPKRKAR